MADAVISFNVEQKVVRKKREVFDDIWTQVMQSRLVICGSMPRSVGELRLLPLLIRQSRQRKYARQP
jgi:hypothetical protein